MNVIRSSRLQCGAILLLLVATGLVWSQPSPQPTPPPAGAGVAAAQAERKLFAVGQWSEPVFGLRGRLVLAEGHLLGQGKTYETVVFLEMENVTGVHELELRFDPRLLECELVDAEGESVPRTPGGGSGGEPGAFKFILPRDASIRLRTNMYGYGLDRATGFLIPSRPYKGGPWTIRPDDKRDYFFRGTFTIELPADEPLTTRSGRIWRGALKLPGAKITAEARR
jgi:hypothetical protein